MAQGKKGVVTGMTWGGHRGDQGVCILPESGGMSQGGQGMSQRGQAGGGEGGGVLGGQLCYHLTAVANACEAEHMHTDLHAH